MLSVFAWRERERERERDVDRDLLFTESATRHTWADEQKVKIGSQV